MLHTVWKGGSLRTWISIGMTLAIVPLAVSSISGYVMLHRGVTMAFQDIDVRQDEEIGTAQHLRILMLEAGEPLDSFIAEGLPHQPPAYRSLQRRIVVGFDALDHYLADDSTQRDSAADALKLWTRADSAAMAALARPHAAGDRRADSLMDRFHLLSDSAVTILDQMDNMLGTEMREEVFRHIGRSRRLTLLAGALSLIAIAAGVLLIGQVMSRSVERLVSGAARFASGDREHRIDIQVPPELHRVAEEFNRMIGRIHESEDALADLARRDPLTRLLNRRAFDEALAEAFARLQRMGETFAVLVFDLDHFKQINDRYGHGGGDEVLRETARRMEGQLRPLDHLFRIGGEEFAAILAASGLSDAEGVGERLRAVVADTPVTSGAQMVPVTVSVGVAEASASITPSALVELADAALYRAKAAGRNRVVTG